MKRCTIKMTDSLDVPDEDHVMAQVDEVVALSIIYPDEFHLVSNNSGEDLEDYQGYEHPIRLSVQLSTKLFLQVEYPTLYPDAAPVLSLDVVGPCDEGGQETSPLLEAMEAEIQVGMPCILQCVNAGKEYLEEMVFDDSTNGGNKAEDTTAENDLVEHSSVDPFDILPRPLLSIILYDYCSVRERGRLSVASKLIGTMIERRSQRTFAKLEGSNSDVILDDWHQHRTMTIDGVLHEPWELDLVRAKEERKIQTSHELLWRKQRTTTFRLSPERDVWRCECLVVQDSGDDNAQTRGSWTFQNFVFHYGRASIPIINVEETHWYLARVRLRALLAEDGDVFVGLVKQPFDESPQHYFQILPGGGFGVESEQCAFLNIISGQNVHGGHPMEINIGLKVNGTRMEYGIPRGLHLGRPIYNNGLWEVQCMMPIRNDSCDIGVGQVFLAVVASRTLEQSDLHTMVSIEECSEAEWHRTMVEPYNNL